MTECFFGGKWGLPARHCYISSHEELCEVEQADDN